jgi:hypothetical protein
LTDSLVSILINVSSDNPKFLVFYDEDMEETNKKNSLNKTDTEESSSETTKKRAKLGFDAFTKKLK